MRELECVGRHTVLFAQPCVETAIMWDKLWDLKRIYEALVFDMWYCASLNSMAFSLSF